MVKITKELEDSQAIILLIHGPKYNKALVDVAKKLSKKKICYVTFNKTYDSLKEMFEKQNIKTENIAFVDAITKNITKANNVMDGCYFVSSPSALTEISIAISKFLEHEFDYLVLDSLTNMLIYRDKKDVEKFVLNLVNKVKQRKTRATLYTLHTNDGLDLVEQCGSFVDKVLQFK